jgi:hypothetical protein
VGKNSAGPTWPPEVELLPPLELLSLLPVELPVSGPPLEVPEDVDPSLDAFVPEVELEPVPDVAAGPLVVPPDVPVVPLPLPPPSSPQAAMRIEMLANQTARRRTLGL